MELKEFLKKWLKPIDENSIAEFEKDLDLVEFETERHNLIDYEPESPEVEKDNLDD